MERQVTVCLPEGLHARPAADFAKAALTYQCRVDVVTESRSVNARSLLSLLSLGVQCGQNVVLRAEGPDAEAALTGLTAMLEGHV